jgi:steroid delta-isomerase-like uncharacterized protein
MSEGNKTIVRRIYSEIINGGNLALADSLVGPGYVYHGSGGLELRGPEGFKQLVSMYRSAFPDLNLTIDDIVTEGDKVVTRWTGRGTHKGDLAGIRATGRTATVTGIVITRIVDGKVVEDHEAFDELSMLRQLGVTTIPAPAHA